MAVDRKWIVKEPGNPALVRQLSAELGIDHVLANLLIQRNIKSYEQAREFFRPDLARLHDPFLMTDMDKAVRRLDQASKSLELSVFSHEVSLTAKSYDDSFITIDLSDGSTF